MSGYRSPLGLDVEQRFAARQKALYSARTALAHAGIMRYSEGAERWSGIDEHRRAYRGEYPPVADCSAFVTWCLWDGTLLEKLSDFVNGERWRAGYTGTMTQHGVSVMGRRLLVGDAIFYGGTRDVPQHVTIYVGSGRVISHGSPGGPRLLPIRYWDEIVDMRRYIR